MTTFTIDETKAILNHPAVHRGMQRIVAERIVPESLRATPLPPWTFHGRENPTGPFRLFRYSVETAINLAVIAALGRERERLLIALRLTDSDEGPAVKQVAKQVAETCEQYAVMMQHGAEGWESYKAHVQSYKDLIASYTQP